MSMVLFNAVNSKIETLYDEQKQPWFKQVDVGDFVGIVNMRDATCNLSLQDKKSRDEITVGATDGSYKPPKHAKPHDGFLSVNGITTVLVNSRKSKARQVTAWLIYDVMPRGFNKIIEEKQQAIEGHQLAIEENLVAIENKDTQLALLNDDLQARQYENVGLQGEVRAKNTEIDRGHNQIVDLIENRHVPRRDGIDTVLCPIVKNDPDETGKTGAYEYYMIRCQERVLKYHINCLRLRYPQMTVKTYCDDGNAIHRFSRFTKDVLQKPNYHRNHFNLTCEASRDLFYTLFRVDMEDPEDDNAEY